LQVDGIWAASGWAPIAIVPATPVLFATMHWKYTETLAVWSASVPRVVLPAA
jgi:hypothetical protein